MPDVTLLFSTVQSQWSFQPGPPIAGRFAPKCDRGCQNVADTVHTSLNMLAKITTEPIEAMDVSAALEYMLRFDETQRIKSELSDGKVLFLGVFGGKNVATPDYSKAITAKDPRCFLDGAVLLLENHCLLCSTYNAKNCWKDLGLRRVCGSLGFGKGSPWFEHGSPTFTTVRDFTGSKPVDWDWHVWLEDSDGRVYDVVSAAWHGIAAVHGKKLGLGSPAESLVVAGKTRGWLRSHGLDYVEAPMETQTVLFAVADRVYGVYFKALGLQE